MKNVHLIETDKPSRLHITGALNLYPNGILGKSQGLCKNQNIYITNDEEIKEGDYVYFPTSDEVLRIGNDPFESSLEIVKDNKDCKKIILTTDNEDLIKEGVQKIDDEFLEWFVKNPSCEYVDQRLVWNEEKLTSIYKIIIPKKEPINCEYCGGDGIYVDGDNNTSKCTMCEKGKVPKEENSIEANQRAKNYMSLKGALEPKQETAVEFLKKEYIKRGDCLPSGVFKDALEIEAKQDLNKYSEEEVRNLFKKYQYDLAQWVLRMEDDISNKLIPVEWFEQNKKK